VCDYAICIARERCRRHSLKILVWLITYGFVDVCYVLALLDGRDADFESYHDCRRLVIIPRYKQANRTNRRLKIVQVRAELFEFIEQGDATNGLMFPNLNKPPFDGQTFDTNLIMPEPCPFLSRKLPKCSIIRPTETKGISMGVVKFLTDMGLFIGQPKEFFEMMRDLAEEADEARRECD
jgi:hypothetical protein